MLAEGCDFVRACEILVGMPAPRGGGQAMTVEERRRRQEKREADQRKRQAEAEADQQRRYNTAKGVWLNSGPLGEIAHAYLRSRGIDPQYADEKEIRFHQGLPHPEGGSFPCLVAKVSGLTGLGVGVWRIYLKPDGSGKAPREKPKLGLGNVAGGAVRVGGLWPRIAVAEGIETALAVRQFLHETTGQLSPVWAALSTSGVAGLVPPDIVSMVDIFADGDTMKPPQGKRTNWLPSPGLKAAEQLKERINQLGKGAHIHLPPSGSDWCDVLNEVRKKECA
jgi:hypothetical protein